MGLLDVVGSVMTGGLTGILGGAVQLLFSWLNAKAEIQKMEVQGKIQVDIITAKAQAAKTEWDARAQVAAREAEGKAAVADADAVARSNEADAKIDLLGKIEAPEGKGWWARGVKGFVWMLAGLAEVWRATMRPGLTVYLAIMVTLLYLEAQRMIQAMDASWHMEMAQQVYVFIVQTLLYLFGVALAWWFATRKVPELMKVK